MGHALSSVSSQRNWDLSLRGFAKQSSSRKKQIASQSLAMTVSIFFSSEPEGHGVKQRSIGKYGLALRMNLPREPVATGVPAGPEIMTARDGGRRHEKEPFSGHKRNLMFQAP
jgi:hypothetical protein